MVETFEQILNNGERICGLKVLYRLLTISVLKGSSNKTTKQTLIGYAQVPKSSKSLKKGSFRYHPPRSIISKNADQTPKKSLD